MPPAKTKVTPMTRSIAPLRVKKQILRAKPIQSPTRKGKK
jgi:hypothetical protein